MSLSLPVNSRRFTATENTLGASSSAPQFSVITAFEPGRKLSESYIAEKFRLSYGAEISEFMPELLLMHRGAINSGCQQDLRAALGMRRGTDSRALFLETYLDVPAEVILSEKIGKTVSRSDLMEIGNLVATQRGASQMLFTALTLLLCQQGVTWAIFTATPEVQKLLNRLKLKQFFLAEADPARLGEAQSQWGSYYHSNPAVIAVNARKALQVLQRHPLTASMLQSCEASLGQAPVMQA
ncbi:thermostable hemolysin [Spongiibacter sp. KMU-158]|uniref:Thermostable hemolysin n=1 Tax=Spongiibacter pelagi TaxID=2760804 RepID=A0A927C2C1_9GAMM|nr:thermostable hemolysin [Spongiibacter pelagi]MBD2858356.1 thermostable hemolysin [Spongiibacter pelagi]